MITPQQSLRSAGVLFCSVNWNWFYNFSAIRFTLSHIGNVPSTLIIGQHIVDSQSLTKFSSLDAQKLWNDMICSKNSPPLQLFSPKSMYDLSYTRFNRISLGTSMEITHFKWEINSSPKLPAIQIHNIFHF